MGGAPAHKAYDGIGLIWIDTLGPHNVWIGHKLRRMQITPFMKPAVPEMAWSKILREPGRGDNTTGEGQAQAITQRGGFRIRKSQVWHTEESGRQGHGNSPNGYGEVRTKLA